MRSLHDGDEVEFDVEKNPKDGRSIAVNVRKIGL